MTERKEVFVTKGTRVRASWLKAKTNPPASLAGMQLKFDAEWVEIEGVVTDIRGDHPTHPTRVGFIVRQDDGVEVVVRREWIRAVLGGSE